MTPTELLAALEAATGQVPVDPKMWLVEHMRRIAALRARGVG